MSTCYPYLWCVDNLIDGVLIVVGLTRLSSLTVVLYVRIVSCSQECQVEFGSGACYDRMITEIWNLD